MYLTHALAPMAIYQLDQTNHSGPNLYTLLKCDSLNSLGTLGPRAQACLHAMVTVRDK